MEGANLQLAAVVTAVFGVRARARLDAVIGGSADADGLAELARGRLRAKLPQLRRALEGRTQAHHRFLLAPMLTPSEYLEEAIAQVQQESDQRLQGYEEAVTLLQTIPAGKATAAATSSAEIGVEMRCFPSANHLASWAGVCPGTKQSGGKRLSGRLTKGTRYVRAILAEVVWSITRPNTYLAAQYHRLARRKGQRRAIMAVAHSVLVISSQVLRDKAPYRDLGEASFDRLDTERIQRYHIHRLEHLGYTVTLASAPGAAGAN